MTGTLLFQWSQWRGAAGLVAGGAPAQWGSSLAGTAEGATVGVRIAPLAAQRDVQSDACTLDDRLPRLVIVRVVIIRLIGGRR